MKRLSVTPNRRSPFHISISKMLPLSRLGSWCRVNFRAPTFRYYQKEDFQSRLGFLFGQDLCEIQSTVAGKLVLSNFTNLASDLCYSFEIKMKGTRHDIQ